MEFPFGELPVAMCDFHMLVLFVHCITIHFDFNIIQRLQFLDYVKRTIISVDSDPVNTICY